MEDESKLATLLEYWMDHNREHEEEFRDWARRTLPTNVEASDMLVKAADALANATTWLEKAGAALAED